jgi:hypothetical protein
MRSEAYRQFCHVAALTQGELRAERIDMHFTACGFAGIAKPVAHLPVFLAQGQPLDAALRRAAEPRGIVDVAP